MLVICKIRITKESKYVQCLANHPFKTELEESLGDVIQLMIWGGV